jgi:hypothetical protein
MKPAYPSSISGIFWASSFAMDIAESYTFTPALRRKVIIGHQFVKADWNRFKPTKAVNRNQYGFTQYASASESKTKAPAISLI